VYSVIYIYLLLNRTNNTQYKKYKKNTNRHYWQYWYKIKYTASRWKIKFPQVQQEQSFSAYHTGL